MNSDIVPKVSVSITAYNHEKYISQCLDSVLRQKTDFDFEILLGEDDSNDKTREICKHYAEKYPNRIRLFLHSRDSVIYIDGNPTGRFNFINNLKQAEGKYIALLDGDDFWITDDKLQKQIDYLEANPGFSVCFTNALILDENTGNEKLFLDKPLSKDEFTIEDVAKSNFFPTASVVFRNTYKGNYPHWYEKFRAGDWGLHILNLLNGKAKYLNECTSVYRMHNSGTWSTKSRAEQFQKIINMYDVFIENMPVKYRSVFIQEKSNWENNLRNELSPKQNRNSRSVLSFFKFKFRKR